MSKINILDSKVFNKIAAGEVVERPASVVKEIMENSIDAGATSIQIIIENGGIGKIQIIDNGSGIERDDIKKAFLPHATSKIKDVEDLFNIGTLGFRGEALASICSVSKLTMMTKTNGSESGSIIEIDGGDFGEVKDIGVPNGTNIIVENLFYNVPARLKFLKKPKQEEQEITSLISKMILANPGLNIKYVADKHEIYNHRSGTLADAIYSVYGKEASMNMLEVVSNFSGLKITGFTSKPSYSKPNRTYQTLILNGRIIENSIISLSVANAYGETLMKRQYPFFVLNLDVDPKDVDVNVHPNKKEVRFENSNKIFGAVFTAISDALLRHRDVKNIESFGGDFAETVENVPNNKNAKCSINNEKNAKKQQNFNNFNNIFHKNSVHMATANDVFYSRSISDDAESLEQKSNAEEQLNYDNGEVAIEKTIHTSDVNGEDSITKIRIIENVPQTNFEEVHDGEYLNNNDGKLKSEESFVQDNLFANENEFKLIGTVFDTYIIVQKDNEVYFIDQHAGHEKLLYDKLMQESKNRETQIQQLLLPEIVKVNPIERNYIEDNIENLKELGFDISLFGDDCYKISAVPLLLSDIDIKDFWVELLSELKDFSKKHITDFIKDRLASCACKHAVKAGNVLSEKEIRILLSNLSNDKVALHCPHGRPIVVRIGKAEIEKWFKRIV